MNPLDTFRGYTVDWRLREFRRIEYGRLPVFLPFGSRSGRKLLALMAGLALEALREAQG